MTTHLLNLDTADGPERPDLIDAAWRHHRRECPDCRCIGRFKFFNVTGTSLVENVDGIPSGLSTEVTPVMSATFTRPTEEQP